MTAVFIELLPQLKEYRQYQQTKGNIPIRNILCRFLDLYGRISTFRKIYINETPPPKNRNTSHHKMVPSFKCVITFPFSLQITNNNIALTPY